MSYCNSSTLVKIEDEQRTARPLPCRAWTCPDCAPGRQHRLIAEAIGGQPNTFLTLTIRQDDTKPRARQARELSHAWRHLRLRAIREMARDPKVDPEPFGPKPLAGWQRDGFGRVPRKIHAPRRIPFLAIFEATPGQGLPHLHILLRSEWLDQEWLSLNMDDLVQSPVVDVRRIRHRSQVAGYCAKYAGKQPHRFQGCKRYWKARDYERRLRWRTKRTQSPGTTFQRSTLLLFELEIVWKRNGWSVEWTDQGELRGRPPPR